ncbi:MAG TPA: hypothetical protein PKE69_22775 [Pyrinomonadaceae bacterium]|nr:hypothetical protein [Pyrinomonadaceae bacterium]
MKIKILLCLLFIFAFSTVSLAQSVKITPRKVTYTRPKPMADFKKTFTVNYPKVKAATNALSKKIEASISFGKNFNFKVKDEMGEYQWLEEADYDVGYNKNGILSIYLSMSGTAAYPASIGKTVVVNLKTGNQIKPADVFTNLVGLAKEIKKKQQAEIKQANEDYKKDSETSDFDASEYFNDADFKVENLEGFAVSESGVIFIYDYGFPHVIQALQPTGNYSVTWAELKPFIKRGGLLEQFVR